MLMHRVGPAPAETNFDLMGRVFKPPTGKEMLRRQHEKRTGRQALITRTGLTHPNIKPAVRCYGEQWRHKRNPMDIGEMAWPEDQWDDGECEDAHSIGYATGSAKGKQAYKGKHANGSGKTQELDRGSTEWKGAGGKPGVRKIPASYPTVAAVRRVAKSKEKGHWEEGSV